MSTSNHRKTIAKKKKIENRQNKMLTKKGWINISKYAWGICFLVFLFVFQRAKIWAPPSAVSCKHPEGVVGVGGCLYVCRGGGGAFRFFLVGDVKVLITFNISIHWLSWIRVLLTSTPSQLKLTTRNRVLGVYDIFVSTFESLYAWHL